MRKILLAGLSLALISSAALAQSAPPPPPPPGAPAMGGHEWRHRDWAAESEHMQTHLRQALQLRPDQDGALKTFVEAMRPPEPEGMMGGEHKMGADHKMGEGPVSAPEAMERRLSFARKRLEVAEKRVAAVKAFYAALTPAQQKAFDVMHAHMAHERDGDKGQGKGWRGER